MMNSGITPWLVQAGLASPIATRISAESKKAMQQPDVSPKLDKLGLTSIGSTPGELATLLRQDIDTIAALVNAIGIKPE